MPPCEEVLKKAKIEEKHSSTHPDSQHDLSQGFH